MQRGMIVSSLRQLVRRASVRPSMSGPWSYPLLNQCGYTTSRDDLLAAAYEVNHGTPFPDQKSQQALPPEPVAESALPKFDYASAAPTTASAGSGAVNGSIISKLRVEQGLPPDGSEDYSPNAATANFIAQQTALSSTASPTGVQEIAPAPSTDVNRSRAAPCIVVSWRRFRGGSELANCRCAGSGEALVKQASAPAAMAGLLPPADGLCSQVDTYTKRR